MQDHEIAAFDGQHVTVTYDVGQPIGQLTATGFLEFHQPPAEPSPVTGLKGLSTAYVVPLELRPRRERNSTGIIPDQIVSITPADLPPPPATKVEF